MEFISRKNAILEEIQNGSLQAIKFNYNSYNIETAKEWIEANKHKYIRYYEFNDYILFIIHKEVLGAYSINVNKYKDIELIYQYFL